MKTLFKLDIDDFQKKIIRIQISCNFLHQVKAKLGIFLDSKRYPFSPKVAWIHTLITGQRGTMPGVEKHTISRVFVYGDGLRYLPSDLPRTPS